METLANAVLVAAPAAMGWGVLVLAGAAYLTRRARVALPRVPYRFLAAAMTAFHIAYAGALTVGQYLLWSQDGLGRAFLRMPLDPSLPIPTVQWFPGLFGSALGYFLFYSWGRFWLHALLSVGAALVVWWFLRALSRRNERFFEQGEVTLGFVGALVAGWPNVLVFLVVAFLSVVLISLGRLVLLRERLTTLGVPFLIGAAAALALGNVLAAASGLAVLAL